MFKRNHRVIIFIDGSNLYYGLRNDFGKTHLDFEKFSYALTGERHLIRVHYYIAPMPESIDAEGYESQQRFLDRLRDTPYLRVNFGRLESRNGTLVEKGVDIQLAVDMLTLAIRDTYDIGILVTGDGDFDSVVRAVQDLGKHVENATCQSTMSKHLRQTCDKFTLLDEELLRDCWLY
jgi:uncharacterized LabA/DUF88 family protein